MRVRRLWWSPLPLAALLACEPNSLTEPPEASLHRGDGPIAAIVAGGGKFDVNIAGGSVGTFGFGAVGRADQSAVGRLFYQLEFQGQHVEFHGVVTCLSVDRANRRAWIGGVVTQNRSEHPSYTTPRTQPGRDIWFRILENGTGSGAEPDRTTFVGFEGDRGIITSEEYCQVQPWAANNAATWSVVAGNITLH